MVHVSDLISEDIESYLAAHEQKELLRLVVMILHRFNRLIYFLKPNTLSVLWSLRRKIVLRPSESDIAE